MIYAFYFMSLESIRLGFVTIAHPRDFVMSPKMYSLFPLPSQNNQRVRVSLELPFQQLSGSLLECGVRNPP
jgi:hypothetical protein